MLVIPELVDWYKSPDVVVQLEDGVSKGETPQEKLSLVGCANKIFETNVKMITSVLVRAVACNMVLKGFWNSKKILETKNIYKHLLISKHSFAIFISKIPYQF